MMTSDLPAASSTSAASVVGAGQAAELPARRHAADEDVGIGGVRLHPQPIAEDRAAGERAGGIDGDDADASRRAARVSVVSRSTSVLLPAPGGPVTPTR